MKFLRAALLPLLCCAALLSLVVPASVAGAAGNGDWSVFPTSDPSNPQPRSQFDLSLQPGMVYEDSVTVGNETDAPLDFYLYAADAYNTETGGFSLVNRFEAPLDMGAWVKLPVAELRVPANDEVDVPFTIEVPADAEPGDHIGGIVAENIEISEAQLDDTGTGLSISQAVGTRIYGRVEGPIDASLEVTDLTIITDAGASALFGDEVSAGLEVTIVNNGNIRQSPGVLATLEPLIGSSTELEAVGVPEILPGGSAKLTYEPVSIRPLGRLTADVDVIAADTTTSASTTKWIIPWAIVLLLPLLLAALFIVWRRRKRQRPTSAQHSEQVQEALDALVDT